MLGKKDKEQHYRFTHILLVLLNFNANNLNKFAVNFAYNVTVQISRSIQKIILCFYKFKFVIKD